MAKKTIGSLLVEIGVDLTDFEKKMGQFQREFGKVGQQVQDAATQIGLAFGGVSLAIGGGLAATVKKAADFEQGLSNIKAVSGATAQEMENLKELALQMGADTKYSATEAAVGIEELVKAGVSMTDIINGGLKGALSLATAGGLELGEAAEIASTALNAFKSDNLSVIQASDILAGAANASATSVGELKFGLASVAAVASSVGMSFEDTTTALAVFAQNGLKGSDAGTSLKTMLMNLQPSTDKAAALFEKLGLTAEDGSSKFFDANGQLKSLDQIASILNGSMSGLTDAQRLMAMETIFGSDAIRAANILFKEGETGVTNMKTAMGKVTAEQVAAEKMNNLNGSIEQLKGAFETLMISLGETLVPILTKLADKLGGIVDWFNSLSPLTKQMAVIGAVLAMALTGLIAVVAFLAVGLGALAAAEWAVILPLAGIIAAVVAVIAIFALLAFGIKKLYDENETFRSTVQAVWSGIKKIIKAAVDAILPVAISIWNTIKENLMEMWTIVEPLLTEIGAFIKSFFSSFSSEGDSKLAALKKAFEVTFGLIGTNIKIQIEIITTIIKLALTFLITAFRTTFTGIKLVVSTVIEGIKVTIQTAMDIIKGIIKVVSAIIRGDWEGAWTAIKETVSNVLGNIKTYLTNMKSIFMDAGKGFISALADGIKNAAGTATDAVKDVVSKVRDYLPFSPAKVGPLSDLDKLDFQNPITTAIRAGIPAVQSSMNAMLQVPDVNPSIMNDMGAGTTVILQLDGKTIARNTFNHMGGTFRARGAVT